MILKLAAIYIVLLEIAVPEKDEIYTHPNRSGCIYDDWTSVSDIA